LTVGLPQSTQCLNTRDTARSGIDERLKASERLPVDHEASLADLVFGMSLITGWANRAEPLYKEAQPVRVARMQPDSDGLMFTR
jgi:hypothetical protein